MPIDVTFFSKNSFKRKKIYQLLKVLWNNDGKKLFKENDSPSTKS